MNDSLLSNGQTPSKKSRLKRIGIPIAIIFGGIVILGLAMSLAKKPQKKPLVQKAPLVEVLEVSQGEVTFTIESQGSISPRTETTLVSEVSGVIKQVSSKFVAGGFFKRGELIMEIDPISYEVALLQAQARLEGAEAKLVEETARSKQAQEEWRLTGRKVDSAPILALREPQLQQAQADVKAAQADLKNAQIKLERTRIVAPYDAMVKDKRVDIGQYVSIGSQLAVTFAVDYAEIRLPIKEQDFAYIDVPALGSVNAIGSKVELTLGQGRERKYWQTYITRSEGVVDSQSRVNYVVAQINDPYGLLSDEPQREPIRIGTFVKAQIFSQPVADIITVPRKALRGADQLYLVDEKRKLKFSTVNILRSDADNIYLTEGLSPGEKIVLTKLTPAVAGMSVRVEGDPLNDPQAEEEVIAEDSGEQIKTESSVDDASKPQAKAANDNTDDSNRVKQTDNQSASGAKVQRGDGL